MELRGIEYLRKKLNLYQGRVNLRYKYYAMQHYRAPIGITIPAHVRAKYRAILGWTAKGVDCLADRLVFREFTNDDFNVTEIFDRNNPDILFDSAILAALIGSCCFIYISKGEDDEVRLQVIEASNATGVIDPITGLLVEGYAVLARDDYNQPTLEAYFEPNATHFIPKNGRPYSVANEAGIPLLVPVIHRPDAVRPFGRSRITRSGMYYQKEAEQTFERANITAEFYSWPQKYIIGLDPDAEQLETYKATVSSLLTISASDGGEKPSIGQFTTASMSPFTEQLRTAAAGFAGEMGLTLDDMGFVSDNPSSVEAIKASHENLRLAGRKAQRSLGAGLLNVAYVAACLRDEFHYARSQFVRTTVKWEPLFEADANTMTMIGDGVVKLNQALPGYINAETIRDLTGIAGDMSAKPAISEVVTDGT
ncbi:phage portal protein [Streptococcus mitis]|uniref:Phage portal protein, SPP1 Gp6-like protein n=1 Tax=Streptococcus mitis TaxID=28037 RepID=A0A0F2DR35_STRMT|nr:phage portal protein [Streptococcus mitis]KJQ73373.1 Phage portal protein, SPP1 Gp6-like protein [Streptococcus mitis]QBX26567.1 portal protein [Streptococcus phage Javan330]